MIKPCICDTSTTNNSAENEILYGSVYIKVSNYIKLKSKQTELSVADGKDVGRIVRDGFNI